MGENATGFNLLLRSTLPVCVWRERLTAVAACLYECNFGAWRAFEPERKRLDEALSYLEYEGLVSFEDTVDKALQTLFTEIEDSGARWTAASRVAERALGAEKLRDLVKPTEEEH